MTQLLNALPGALAQGLIWGVMAIGVYITYKVLDIADLTVDGSICTGAAVCTMLLLGGQSPWLALLCAVLGRRGGRMTVQLGGVILGAVIYYIVYQVIIFAGFDTDLLKMFSAVVVAVFLGAPHVKAQLKAHSRSKKGDSGHAENE